MSGAIHLSLCRPRFLPRGQKIRVSQPRFSIPSVGSVWLNQLFTASTIRNIFVPTSTSNAALHNIDVTSTFSATRGNSKHIA